jgi:hypothetical protein
MRTCVLVFVALVTLCAAMVSYALEVLGIPPRRLAPYVEQRMSGHGPTMVAIGHWMGETLLIADRGRVRKSGPMRLTIGAQPEASISPARVPKRRVSVASTTAALAAFSNARPGDEITLTAGRYRFSGSNIAINRLGTKDQPITVHAARPESVFLEFDMTEGFLVSAPYWTFENLAITGVCKAHSDCEHAFHVVGNATHFTARNNTVSNFNAHFKVNGANGKMPDAGLIESNTLSNTTVRHTGNPVTVIDLVAASDWTIRKNFIADFIKEEGNQISYGGFAKGAGSGNVFENNIVLCEYMLVGLPGQRVGLSLGGGGTGPQFCRDKRCITEQEGSAVRGNLIAACSGDGIYVNRSATTKVIHNTLIDTGGISVRYPESSADVEGNLVDGKIRSREDGVLREVDNLDTSTTRLYLGSHPLRQMLERSGSGALDGDAPRRSSIGNSDGLPPDLCAPRALSVAHYGAFANFTDCLR